MKTILPWVVAVLALGGAFFFYNSNQTRSAEVAKLQSDVQELQALRTENAELKDRQVPADELARLRKNTEEVLRLRNTVRQLSDAKTQLEKQTQTAQGEIQRVQAQAQAAQAQAQSLTTNLQALSAQQQALTAQMAAKQQITASLNSCINQLRQIDSATQQWALEAGKKDTDPPDAAAIALYIKGGVFPGCPQGGTYKLGATLGANPSVTCSIPGHVMQPPPQ